MKEEIPGLTITIECPDSCYFQQWVKINPLDFIENINKNEVRRILIQAANIAVDFIAAGLHGHYAKEEQ